MKNDKYLEKMTKIKMKLTLFFDVCRDIEEAFIPSDIRTIASCAFYQYSHIRKAEFQADSNLEKIGERAFSFSYIEEMTSFHQK